MASNYFDFKQFRVYHDRCAQKVGTDGVVLGAWAEVEGARRILDIGTGSGLIALMMAQRAPGALVTGVDIDPAAVGQAQENVAASPFASRINIDLSDIRTYSGMSQDAEKDGSSIHNENHFDHIICNPPFYTEGTLPPDDLRALARNAACLPFEQLMDAVCRLLDEDGVFSVMLPSAWAKPFHVICTARGLHLRRSCSIKTVPRKAPKRVMTTYSRCVNNEPIYEELILQNGNEKSAAYKELARDFYL